MIAEWSNEWDINYYIRCHVHGFLPIGVYAHPLTLFNTHWCKSGTPCCFPFTWGMFFALNLRMLKGIGFTDPFIKPWIYFNITVCFVQSLIKYKLSQIIYNGGHNGWCQTYTCNLDINPYGCHCICIQIVFVTLPSMSMNSILTYERTEWVWTDQSQIKKQVFANPMSHCNGWEWDSRTIIA